MIEIGMQEKQAKKESLTRFERSIRSGVRSNRDCAQTLGFPNYFTAQKVRAKITQQEEQKGNQVLLKVDEKKKKKR
jgi:hypothetical protein